MINPERFHCAFYGAKDKVLNKLTVDFKEGESGPIFGKFV